MYNVLVTIHIIAAGIWLSNFIFSSVIKDQVKGNLRNNLNLVSFYLKYSNIIGMVGSMMILLTGITLVVMSSHFTFLEMKANHWLSTKQIIMVVILIMIFAFLIPSAKKLKKTLADNLSGDSEFKSFNKINLTLNILVLINFLLAISRWFMNS